MPNLSNINTELTVSLLALTENFQSNQSDKGDSFNYSFQEQISSQANMASKERQTTSGNRQENSPETGAESHKNAQTEQSENKKEKNINASEYLREKDKFNEANFIQEGFIIKESKIDNKNKDAKELEEIVDYNEAVIYAQPLLTDAIRATVIAKDQENNSQNSVENLFENTTLRQEQVAALFPKDQEENIFTPVLEEDKITDNLIEIQTKKTIDNKQEDTVLENKIAPKEAVNQEYLEANHESMKLFQTKNVEDKANESSVRKTLMFRQDTDAKEKDLEVDFKELINQRQEGAEVSEIERENASIDNQINTSRSDIQDAKFKIEDSNNKASKFEEVLTKLEQQIPQKNLDTGIKQNKIAQDSPKKIDTDPINQSPVKSYRQLQQQVARYEKSSASIEEGISTSIKGDYIEHSVFDGKWGKYFGEKLLQLSMQGTKQAILYIDPPELGPLDVHIELEKDKTQISFASLHAPVREVLENNSFKLKELFFQHGLPNLQVNVSDKESTQQNSSEHSYKPPKAISLETTNPKATGYQYRPEGLVDYFA